MEIGTIDLFRIAPVVAVLSGIIVMILIERSRSGKARSSRKRN